MQYLTKSLVAALLVASLVVAPACAQEDTAMLAPIVITGGQSTTLTEPTSTGSNLGLTLLQTPASVEVIDRTQLTARGEARLIEAITRATGMSASPHPGNGFNALSARGFAGGSSVTRLYDGTRQYGYAIVTFPFDTWAIERIEVLRGPASIIHGDGAIGGIINVIPKKPLPDTPAHEMQTTIGTDNTQRLGLGSGGAMNERLSYRVDVSGNRSDGWVDRGHHGDASFSGALQFEATRDLSLKLSHAYGYQRPMRYFGTPLIAGQQHAALRRKNYNVQDSFLRYRDHWSELAATWTPDDDTTVRAHLYRMGSKRDWRNAERYEYNPASGMIDRSGNTHILHDQAQTGFRGDATFQGQLAGLDNTLSVGLDINRSRFQHTNNTYTGSSGSVDMYDPAPGRFQSDAPFIPRYRNVAQQFALFLENRIALTPKWSVVGGAALRPCTRAAHRPGDAAAQLQPHLFRCGATSGRSLRSDTRLGAVRAVFPCNRSGRQSAVAQPGECRI